MDQALEPCPRCGGATVYWGARGANFYCWTCRKACGQDFYLRNRTRTADYPQEEPREKPAAADVEVQIWSAGFDLTAFRIRKTVWLEFPVPLGTPVDEVPLLAVEAFARAAKMEVAHVRPGEKDRKS